MMLSAFQKTLAFGMVCVVATLSGIAFYHRINVKHINTGIATLEPMESVVKVANSTPWHHPRVTRSHVFMGVTLPETGDCNPSLTGKISRNSRVFPMPETSMVIYNRVSKCGSATVQKIIASLKGLNQFTGRVSHIYDQRRIMNSEQVRHE